GRDGEGGGGGGGERGEVSRRPLLPVEGRPERGRRSRNARGGRQRRCLQVDDRELSVALRSLYREPEQREQLCFGALEFHDVFRIFRSGPAETVALRGLDLRVEPRELVALYGPSGSGKSPALHLAAGRGGPAAGEVVAVRRPPAPVGAAEHAAARARHAALLLPRGPPL